MILTLPCIICGRELKSAFPRENESTPEWLKHNQPHAGTIFITHGQYGSTVFDPMSDVRSLEINICDSCLLDKARQGYVLHNERIPRPPKVNATTWDGDGGEWCEKCQRAHFGPDDKHDDWTPFDAE
jgi:hypothetical protein